MRALENAPIAEDPPWGFLSCALGWSERSIPSVRTPP
jgi:hypothetical protein